MQVPNSTDHVLIFQSLWECKECPPVAPTHRLFWWCSKHLSIADQNYSSFQEPKPNEAFNSLQTYPPSQSHLGHLPYNGYTRIQSSPPFLLCPHPLLPPLSFFRLSSGHSAKHHWLKLKKLLTNTKRTRNDSRSEG